MSADKKSEARSLYAFTVIGLAIWALGNVARRDWLGFASGVCMLAAIILFEAGAADRSRIGKLAYYLLVAGVFVFVTMSFVRD